MMVTDAYVAGIIDGEGCITIESRSNSTSYAIRVDVGMTDRALTLLQALKKQYGGSVSRHRKKSEKWDAASRWTVCGVQAADFLTKVMEHLQLKREQAEIAVRTQSMINDLQSARKGAKKWTEEAIQRARTSKARIQELNRKGPPQQKQKPGFARLVGGQWITDQRDMFEPVGFKPFSGRWPRSGIMLNGVVYQQEPWVPHIEETESSFLPTPNASDATRGPESKETKKKRGSGGVNLSEAAKHWPTPTTRDHKGCGSKGRTRNGKIQTDTLDRAVWAEETSNGLQSTGQLNPQWVSWLMGFPIDWCDLPDEPPIEFQTE